MRLASLLVGAVGCKCLHSRSVGTCNGKPDPPHVPDVVTWLSLSQLAILSSQVTPSVQEHVGDSDSLRTVCEQLSPEPQHPDTKCLSPTDSQADPFFPDPFFFGRFCGIVLFTLRSKCLD